MESAIDSGADDEAHGGTRGGEFDVALERALRAALPDFEARDAWLVLDAEPDGDRGAAAPRRARLAGTLDGGRAALVLHAADQAGPVELAAIDALAWSEENGPLLAARLGADPGAGALVVLVVAAARPGLRAALRTLRAERLLVFEERRLQSARGEELGLLPLALARTADSPDDVAAFLARLDDRNGAAAAAVARGVARIDAGLRPRLSGDALVWRGAEGVACAVRVRANGLVGEVAGATQALGDPEDVERFLERALRAGLAGAQLPERPAARGARRDDVRRDDPPRALLPQGPLLSAAELAALRGD